ncbi:MAG: succinate dehydrogenase/fumarate reductase iron-sulfur subunit [Nitrospirota bacterium]
MRILINIQRYNPEEKRPTYLQEFRVEVKSGMTILDVLMKIKNDIDGSLTFRASCRSAICGSCAMNINGHEKLACKTQIKDELKRHGSITVRPLTNLEIIKDLTVDMEPFWKKIKEITPWLIPLPDCRDIWMGENSDKDFNNVDACIMCSACLSACTAFDVSRGFIGPAGLAKAYRFITDPRDSAKDKRVENLRNKDGIFDCARCYFCWEVCPKDVRPVEAIIRTRRLAIKQGLTDTPGARHITAFIDSVKKEGLLNETMMPIRMIGLDINKVFSMIPLGIKMFFKGKMPLPFKRPIKGIKEIRNIFKARGF